MLNFCCQKLCNRLFFVEFIEANKYEVYVVSMKEFGITKISKAFSHYSTRKIYVKVYLKRGAKI